MKPSLFVIGLALLATTKAAPAAELSATEKIMALTRCLECVYEGCDSSGYTHAYGGDTTASVGATRDTGVRNTDNGQSLFHFVIDRDVVVIGASPPPRRPFAHQGRLPGFFIYAHGVPYFCPTNQIASVWDGHTSDSPFKVDLPGMREPKGIVLQRYARDGSLARVFGMWDRELTRRTPTLRCTDDLDLSVTDSRSNPAFLLADMIRFGAVAQARMICNRAVPYEHAGLERGLRAGCMRPGMPFSTVIQRASLDALGIVTGPGCQRSGIERFFNRLGGQTDESGSRTDAH